jgi:hypothetical protein
MARLIKDLTGAEPVDRFGRVIGPPERITAGSEFEVTIPKLKGPSDGFDPYWCEIRVEGQLYRVPLRAFELAKAA